MERNVLVGGFVLDTHDRGHCKGEYCTIHKFSKHHMVKWPQSWNPIAHRMERSCSHNIEHPDPDEINPEKQHQCDGCCSPFKADLEELTKTYKQPDYLTPTSLGPFYSGNPIEVPVEDFFSDVILTELDSLSIREATVTYTEETK